MLPFYSSTLTPEEQEEIEDITSEEFTEELAKVKFLGMMGHWAVFANGPHHTLCPFTQFPGDSRLHRVREFLEKVQQSETGATEPSTQTCSVVRNQQEAAGDAQAVLGWHLSE